MGRDAEKGAATTDFLLPEGGLSAENSPRRGALSLRGSSVAERARGLRWPAAAAVFYAFAMPSGITGAGNMVGSAGFAVALPVLIAITTASIAGSYMLGEVARDAECVTFSDAGRASFGRWGARAGAALQYANFLLFLPVAIDLCADALRGVFPNAFDCTDYYIFCIAAACLLSTQVRTVANTNLVSYLSCAFIVAIGVIQIAEAQHNPYDGKVDVRAAGNPVAGTEGAIIALLGATTAQWCFVPSFLTVELCHVMRSPQDLTKALAASGVLTVVTMGVVGYAMVGMWGYDLANPVMLSDAWTPVSTGNVSKLMNALLLIANVTGYLLDSVCLGRACAESWIPGFDGDDWSVLACGKYLIATVPTWLFGVVASVLVPNLFAMLAFTTALTVPQCNCIYPALCYARYFICADGAGVKARGPPTTKDFVLVGYTLFVGVASAVVCAVAAVGQVSYKDLRGPTVIGCKGWSIVDES